MSGLADADGSNEDNELALIYRHEWSIASSRT
jgi:hypothetical protein